MSDALYRPKLPDSTIVFGDNEKKVFFIPEKPDWCIANKNFSYVLSLCNGKRTISEIFDIIRYHPFANDAISKLKELVISGYFNENISEESEKHIPRLNNIHLNMTRNCNLRCIYCYAEERNNIKGKDLTYDEYCEIINEVYGINKNCLITFTGGEPLLNSDTIRIARYCKTKGMKTFLLTNGTLITPYNVKDIVEVFDSIRISVDSTNNDIHDKLRGRGAFKNTNNGIEILNKNGVDVKIAMTVTKLNRYDIINMAKLYGKNLIFQPLYNVGRAKQLNIGLTGFEYYEALKEAENAEPNISCVRKLLHNRNHGCFRCAIGNEEVSISEKGNVYPCHMLHVEKYLAGNIRESNFSDIYLNSKLLKDIRKLTVYNKNNCKICPFRLICGGGCWARAFYINGDIKECDEFCWYEITSIKESLLAIDPYNGEIIHQ